MLNNKQGKGDLSTKEGRLFNLVSGIIPDRNLLNIAFICNAANMLKFVGAQIRIVCLFKEASTCLIEPVN